MTASAALGHRIAVVGCPGAGKTTLARTLAERFRLTHVELDSLFHGPDWTPSPPDDFRLAIETALDDAESTGGWVVCGNYGESSGGLHFDRADTIVWLDLSRFLVLRRVIDRTVRRAVHREELWNGNREPMTNFTSWDPEKNVIRWAWVKHPVYRSRYSHATTKEWQHLAVHHLRTPDEVQRWLDAVDQKPT